MSKKAIEAMRKAQSAFDAVLNFIQNTTLRHACKEGKRELDTAIAQLEGQQEPVAFVNDKCAIQATLHGAITLKPGDNLYTAPTAAAINEPFYSGFISGEQDWQVLKTAVDTWGEYEQVMMAIGECGEFLTLMGRKVQGRLVESDMHDEIADVLIMMHQMANIYGIDHVRARVRHKMKKLAAKLNKAIAAAEANPPTPVRLTDRQIEFLRFLNGDGEFEGVCFGEEHSEFVGRYWWRNFIEDVFGNALERKRGGV